MKLRTLFTRRFLFGTAILIMLTAVNYGILLYVRDGSLERPWSYVEKMDGTVLFGRAELLEGGFIDLSDVHSLTYTGHFQGSSEGGEFRIESLNPKMVTVTALDISGTLRIGPNTVRQWGTVPPDSQIYKQLERERGHI